jgi:hypothetical protein
MSIRFGSTLAAVAVLVAVGACAAAPAAPPTAAPPVVTPGPTPVAWPSVAPASPRATASPDSGNVDEPPGGPQLSIEPLDDGTVQASIEDPSAKAWRLVIASIGQGAADRLEIVVETSDVAPLITATEIRDGEVVGEMDLSAFADGNGAAGGCHGTLPVCIGSDGFRVPADGDGVFSVRLALTDPGVPLTITGGTATWPAEPFVLGTWTDTEPFDWVAG